MCFSRHTPSTFGLTYGVMRPERTEEPEETGDPTPESGRWGETPFTEERVRAMRRTRRRPKPTQFDYLHVRRIVEDLTAVLAELGDGASDVLDLYCGTRPYDDLLPATARVVGLDIPGNPYGVADVVSDEFLPFSDDSFDLVMCIEAFHYIAEPETGIAEIGRVLRPGGYTVVAVPFVWEYDRNTLEHRFTGPALQRLFADWEDVSVFENGGRAVSWATLTGSMVHMLEWHVPERMALRMLFHPVFATFYLLVNAVGLALDTGERRYARSSLTLPMNLLVTARRPVRVQDA
jgi:SAM-dependent methyltransferase